MNLHDHVSGTSGVVGRQGTYEWRGCVGSTSCLHPLPHASFKVHFCLLVARSMRLSPRLECEQESHEVLFQSLHRSLQETEARGVSVLPSGRSQCGTPWGACVQCACLPPHLHPAPLLLLNPPASMSACLVCMCSTIMMISYLVYDNFEQYDPDLPSQTVDVDLYGYP